MSGWPAADRKKNGEVFASMKTGRNNRSLRAGRIAKALPAVFFLFVFFLYFSLLSEPYFTDEQDVFYGAYHVIKGQDIYRSFLSQHMPFSYYLTAPIALCGARTVFQFRFGIYLLLSLLWLGIFLRHRKHISAVTLFAVPLLYLSVLKTEYMGTTMISDHWQGIGLVIIQLELIRVLKEGRISRACAGMTAAGILLSLGTTFASAYSLFCFFLAVLLLQLRDLGRAPKGAERAAARKRILREDLRLAGWSLIPFAALLIWYGATGNLENFYSGAYEIVTKVYSRYTGGLGSDPVGVVWETVRQFAGTAVSWVRTLPAAPLSGGLHLISLLGLAACAAAVGRKFFPAGILLFLAAVYGGLRGFDGFHGMAYHAQAAGGLGLCLGWALERLPLGKKDAAPGKGRLRAGWAARAAAAGAGLFLLADFGIWAGYNLLYPQILLDRTLRCEERILDLLTEPGEVIFPCNAPVNSLDVMDLELVPKEASGAVSYPYFYEMWGGRLMDSIREEPRIVLYDGDESIWGYVFREYALDFDAYMGEHYVRLPQAETVWVRKADYPAAAAKLEEAGYGNLLVSNTADTTRNTPVKYYPGQRVTGVFTARERELTAVRFCAACFHRRSDPEILVTLRDGETGETAAESRITGAEIADNLFSRCPLAAELVPGRTYELTFSVERVSGKGDMEFYFTPENELSLAQEYRLPPET